MLGWRNSGFKPPILLLSRNINWLEYVTNNDITSESIKEMVHLNVDQKWTKYSSINHYRNNMRDNINTIILIVNRFTASDAEAITLWVSTLKNSWIIGENTAGTCEFIRPGFFFLPSSGIPTMIPQGVNLGLPAGFTRLDGYGYPPDIYLEKDRWGADSIMELSYELLQRRKINP